MTFEELEMIKQMLNKYTDETLELHDRISVLSQRISSALKINVCECGISATEYTFGHSDWCPKYETK